MARYTSIQLTKETQQKLKKLGGMGESYEDIILRLMGERKNGKGR